MPNIILRGPSPKTLSEKDSSKTTEDENHRRANVAEWILVELQGELVNMSSISELSLSPIRVEFSHNSADVCKHFLDEMGLLKDDESSENVKFNLVGDLHFDNHTGTNVLGKTVVASNFGCISSMTAS